MSLSRPLRPLPNLCVPADLFGIGTLSAFHGGLSVLRCYYLREEGWNGGILLDRPLAGPQSCHLYDPYLHAEVVADIEDIALCLLTPEVGSHLLCKLGQQLGVCGMHRLPLGAPSWRRVEVISNLHAPRFVAWELVVPADGGEREIRVRFASDRAAWDHTTFFMWVPGLPLRDPFDSLHHVLRHAAADPRFS